MVCVQALSSLIPETYLVFPVEDLADSGARHFAETIRKIKQKYVASSVCA